MLGRQAGGIDDFDNQLNDPGQYDNPQDPASLSVVEHLRALSATGKLTLLYLVAVIVFLLCWLRGDWVSAAGVQGGLDPGCAMSVVAELSQQQCGTFVALLLSRIRDQPHHRTRELSLA